MINGIINKNRQCLLMDLEQAYASILYYHMYPTDPGVMMTAPDRSTNHVEGIQLVKDRIISLAPGSGE